jgi:hypothetical protein
MFLTSHFSEGDSGQTKMNFKNRERFFSITDEEQKPLSFFSQVPPVGRIEAIFQPHFSVFHFFCYSPDFAGAVSARWRRIWRNQRRFLSRTCSYTIKSFIFSQVSSLKRNKCLSGPLFCRNSTCLSWRTVQDF